MIRSLFLGTPVHAVPSLEALAGLTEVGLVITQPDRPRGRSHRVEPPPVKVTAQGLGLRLAQPTSRGELVNAVTGSGPFDVGVLVAFGMIIPAEVLAIPRRGILNVHFSLLPRWRGAAPVVRAILEGDAETGVTIIRMDEGLDTGPVLAKTTLSIEPHDTAGEVEDQLALSAASLLSDVLAPYVAGDLGTVAQGPGASYAKKTEPGDARLSFEDPTLFLRAVRAFNPRPGAFVYWRGDRLKVWQAAHGASSSSSSLRPGGLAVVEDRLLVGVGGETVELLHVQPAGGRSMRGVDWARGRRGELGRLS